MQIEQNPIEELESPDDTETSFIVNLRKEAIGGIIIITILKPTNPPTLTPSKPHLHPTLTVINLILLPRILNPPRRTPRKPSRLREPYTLPRTQTRPGAAENTIPQRARRHGTEPTGSQLAGERRDLRRQTARRGGRGAAAVVAPGGERGGGGCEVGGFEREGRACCGRGDGAETACAAGTGGSLHVAWGSFGGVGGGCVGGGEAFD